MTLAGSYNGLAFGPGSSVHVGAHSGWYDLPVVRSSDTPKATEHGAFQGLDLLAERTITLTFRVFADDPVAYQAIMDSIAAATVPQLLELPLYMEGNTKLAYCRPRRRSIPYDAENLRRAGEAVVEFVAKDPRKYAATLSSSDIPIGVSSGGRTYPRTYPLTYGGGTVTSGTLTATNAGNFDTPWTAHIIGPVDNPRLENIDQGKVLDLAISLAAGDYLDLDFNAKSITLNGTASRYSALTAASQWWALSPGDNHIRYAQGGVPVGSVCTFAFRSAYV